MARSSKKSIAVPNPILDGIKHQLSNNVISYPSENSAWVGLARYQLIVGKDHPITEQIARMHKDDQDMIDDLLAEVARRKLSLRGQFLKYLVYHVTEDEDEPFEFDAVTAELIPSHLLDMAKRFARGEDVFEEIECRNKPKGFGSLTAPMMNH